MDEKFQISLLVEILQLEELTKLQEKIDKIREDAENPINIKVNGEDSAIENAKKEIDSIFDSLKEGNVSGLSQGFSETSSELKEIMPFVEDVIANVRNSEDALASMNRYLDEDIVKTGIAGGILQGINEQEKEVENSKKRQNDLTKSALSVSKKMFASLLGIGSIYGILRQAMSAYLSQNEELSNRIKEIKYALGSAIAPVLEWIINLAQVLVSVLDYILKCLGFAGLKFGGIAKASGGASRSTKKTADNTKKTADNLEKANKQLAGFDELNNLSKTEEKTDDLSSGGAGGGGAGGLGSTWNNDLAAKIQEHIAEISAILATSLLVLGAILAFSGVNIPLGLGLMAIGALSLAAIIKENWGSMTPKLAETLATLLGIISGAFLALGALFFFTGVATGLGIALMAIGAASLVAAIAVNWHASDNHVRDTLKTLTGIIGGASLALGALLCLTGVSIPIGIALLALGAASIIASASLNWNSAETNVGKTLQKISAIIGASLLVIGVILALTGVALPLGIALIVAGLGSLYASGKVDWDGLGKKLGKTWDSIKTTASKAWNKIKTTIGDVVKNSSKAIKEKYDELKENLSDSWNNLKNTASTKWNEIKTNISNKAQEAWRDTKTAFNSVGTWFETNVGKPIKDKFNSAFNDAKTKAQNGWTNIKNAFNSVGTWFNDNVKNVISNKFKEVFENTGAGTIYEKAVKGFDNLKRGFANVGSWFDQNVRNPANTSIAGIQSSKTIDVRLNKTNFGVDVHQNGALPVQLDVPILELRQQAKELSWHTKRWQRVGYASGTNYIPNDQLAILHKGEAVIPKEFNGTQGKPYIHNDETNQLLERLIDVVQSKEFKTYITQSEIGQASVNYIRQQSRVMGGSII